MRLLQSLFVGLTLVPFITCSDKLRRQPTQPAQTEETTKLEPTANPEPTTKSELIEVGQRPSYTVTVKVGDDDDDDNDPLQEVQELDERYLACESSNASPYVFDVEEAIKQLRQKGDVTCSNHYGVRGTTCHDVVQHGSAWLVLCGDRHLAVSCLALATYAEYVLEKCMLKGKVGGTYQLQLFQGANRLQVSKPRCKLRREER